MHRVIGAGVTVVALMAGAAATSAQQVLDFSGDGHFCSFAHDDVMPEQLYSFSSSAQAEDLVAEIMSTVGLVPRFRIQAANVPNAAAVIQGDERLIVYSEDANDEGDVMGVRMTTALTVRGEPFPIVDGEGTASDPVVARDPRDPKDLSVLFTYIAKDETQSDVFGIRTRFLI